MFGLTTLRARHLSRSGRHTEALAACGMSDAYVLSRAGMHLSVLDRARGPSVEHALALARLGRIDAALEMGQRYFGKASARTLLGLLAVEAPHLMSHLVRHKEGLDEIKAYCQCASDTTDEVEIDAARISAVHAMMLALRSGKAERARTQFDRLFWEAGLDVPDVAWRSSGIEYKTLSCERYDRALDSDTRISVILTAHNEQEMLPVAVGSLLAQSWRNLEIVLVDDASTDGTFAVAQSLAERDGRIKLVRLHTNVGLWAAKNVGLQQCTGSLITMHDADDWSHYRKIELQAAPLLRDRSLLASSSYMVRVDQQTGAPYTRNARNFLRWNPSSFMFRSGVVGQSGGFLDRLLGSDCEFVARLETMYGVDAHAHVRLPLCIGLQRKGSLSNRFRSGSEALVRFRDWESWRQRHVEGRLQGTELQLVSPQGGTGMREVP
jgi:hypothetical protein